MIENGMIMNQDAYDAQAQEPKMVRCARCNDTVPEYDTENVRGKTICMECREAFYNEQYPELGADYLTENDDQYLKSVSRCADSEDLFYNWWLLGLDKFDRFRILKESYQREKASQGMGYYNGIERDFCINADDWKDFVKSK